VTSLMCAVRPVFSWMTMTPGRLTTALPADARRSPARCPRRRERDVFAFDGGIVGRDRQHRARPFVVAASMAKPDDAVVAVAAVVAARWSSRAPPLSPRRAKCSMS
jgi:hypothetical protein